METKEDNPMLIDEAKILMEDLSTFYTHLKTLNSVWKSGSLLTGLKQNRISLDLCKILLAIIFALDDQHKLVALDLSPLGQTIWVEVSSAVKPSESKRGDNINIKELLN